MKASVAARVWEAPSSGGARVLPLDPGRGAARRPGPAARARAGAGAGAGARLRGSEARVSSAQESSPGPRSAEQPGRRPPGRRFVSSPVAADGSVRGFVWGTVSGSFKSNFSFSGIRFVSAEPPHGSHPPCVLARLPFFPESSKFLILRPRRLALTLGVAFISSNTSQISPARAWGGLAPAPRCSGCRGTACL